MTERAAPAAPRVGRGVTAQLVLVMLLVIALSGVALALLSCVEQTHARTVLASQQEIQQRTLTQTVALRAETMRNYVADYSLWNDMATFAEKPSPEWAKVNLDASLASFKLSQTWVLDRTGKLRHTTGTGTGAEGEGVPGAPLGVAALFTEGPFVHYFVRRADGALVEVRGAWIQREDDIERRSDALGYFFAAKVWEEAYVKGLEPLLGGPVEIAASDAACGALASSTQTASEVVLFGASGQPEGKLCSVVANPIAERMLDFRTKLATYFVVFALLMLAMLALSLRVLVLKPLGIVHGALAGGGHDELERLRARPSEFGALADLVFRYEASVKERHQLQAQLYQAGKMASLGILGAGVAHELNNPLAIVLGFAEQLALGRAGGLQPADEAQAVDAILAEAERMRTIVDHIREFAREDVGAGHTPRPINEVVGRSLLLLRRDLELRGIVLTVELDESLPAIACDRVRLESAMQNLVINARDALDETAAGKPKQITVRTQRSPTASAVTISVEDNGVGIPEAARDRLFEPFFTTKPVGKGTGLGLSIVHSIAREHRGTVTCVSAVGVGTTFVIELPA